MKETKEDIDLRDELINDLSSFYSEAAKASIKTLFRALNTMESGEELPKGFMVHGHSGLTNKITGVSNGITITVVVEVEGNDVIETPPVSNMSGHGPIFENKNFAPVMTKLRDFPQVMETKRRS